MGKKNIFSKKNIYGIIFVLPCVIVLLVMMIYPVFQTITFSFSSITLPQFSMQFNGLENFTRIFARPEIPIIAFNTLLWTLGSVVFRLLLGMVTALVMNTTIPGIKFLRICVLIPWTVPSIVSANSWRWMLQGDYGVLNMTLKYLGMGTLARSWLGSSITAMPSLLLAATWAGYPFVMMMLLSALQGLPKEHFEAAMVDGANRFQRFWHIVLPGIKPVLLIVLVLEAISAINAFDMIYTMTGGGPGNSTEVFGLFIYHLGFTNLDFAGASTISLVLIVFVLLFFLFYLMAQKVMGKRVSL
jgi:multiple sugar transport system permease protein